MKERRELLKKELEQLEKAHRAGIIDDREYTKGKERIERKLIDIDSQIKKYEESTRIVSEIIDGKNKDTEDVKVEVVDIPEEDNYGVIIEENARKNTLSNDKTLKTEESVLVRTDYSDNKSDTDNDLKSRRSDRLSGDQKSHYISERSELKKNASKNTSQKPAMAGQSTFNERLDYKDKDAEKKGKEDESEEVFQDGTEEEDIEEQIEHKIGEDSNSAHDLDYRDKSKEMFKTEFKNGSKSKRETGSLSKESEKKPSPDKKLSLKILQKPKKNNHHNHKTKHIRDDDFDDERGFLRWIVAAFILLVAVGVVWYFTNRPPEIPEYQAPMQNAITGNEVGFSIEGLTITLVVYTDFACPPCRESWQVTQRIKEDYKTSVDVQYKYFPLDSTGLLMSVAAECAQQQGRFEKYADMLFSEPKSNKEQLKTLAAEMNDQQFNMPQFSKCLDNEETKDVVLSDYNEGREKGVVGTPTMFVNGRKIEGFISYTELKKIIDEELY
ncbi:MAG: thioredoxin domain-containing protein [Candidatus Woesearchaeota archaeon]